MIDGTFVGTTPLFKQRIAAGRHVILLIHPQTNETVLKKDLVVTDGQVFTVAP
jgi:hypothetical protein